MIKEKLIEILCRNGYRHLKEFPDGKIAGIGRQLFTTGLFVGLEEFSYQKRYCYENEAQAVVALAIWDGQGDPPGPWIKEKPSDRLNPKWSRDE
jgi:hypothetical protein